MNDKELLKTAEIILEYLDVSEDEKEDFVLGFMEMFLNAVLTASRSRNPEIISDEFIAQVDAMVADETKSIAEITKLIDEKLQELPKSEVDLVTEKSAQFTIAATLDGILEDEMITPENFVLLMQKLKDYANISSEQMPVTES